MFVLRDWCLVALSDLRDSLDVCGVFRKVVDMDFDLGARCAQGVRDHMTTKPIIEEEGERCEAL